MKTGVFLPDRRILCEGDKVRLTNAARSSALGQLIGNATGTLEKCHGLCGGLGNPTHVVHVRWDAGPMAGVGFDHCLPDVEPA